MFEKSTLPKGLCFSGRWVFNWIGLVTIWWYVGVIFFRSLNTHFFHISINNLGGGEIQGTHKCIMTPVRGILVQIVTILRKCSAVELMYVNPLIWKMTLFQNIASNHLKVIIMCYSLSCNKCEIYLLNNFRAIALGTNLPK